MSARPNRILRLALLFHDFGKPECRTTDKQGIDHFHGHPEKSAQIADSILRRLKSDNDTRKSVVRLVRYHDREVRLTMPGVRKAVMEIGEDLFPLLLDVKEADISAQSGYRRQEKLDLLAAVRRLYSEILEAEDCISLRDLAVNGGDLIANGMKPGRQIGEVLQMMLSDVVEDPSHNDRDYLLKKYVPTK